MSTTGGWLPFIDRDNGELIANAIAVIQSPAWQGKFVTMAGSGGRIRTNAMPILLTRHAAIAYATAVINQVRSDIAQRQRASLEGGTNATRQER